MRYLIKNQNDEYYFGIVDVSPTKVLPLFTADISKAFTYIFKTAVFVSKNILKNSPADTSIIILPCSEALEVKDDNA